MSKRTQSIRSMFAGKVDEAAPSSQESPAAVAPTPATPLTRVTSGAVKSLKETFSGVERDYQALREQLATGTVAIEIDPARVDPSPFADRFSEQDPASFETLKASIAERGQEIPILVREHPAHPGRYQSAYGHRRVRALKDLGRPVKAYVRALTDEDLVLAQGIENSSREDLSFIERAVFALKLETAGFQRSVIQSALTIDRAEASKLIAVAKSVPSDIIDGIGRSPKIGRGRWQAFADVLQEEDVLARVRQALSTDKIRRLPTDERFSAVLTAASGREEEASEKDAVIATAKSGREIARLVPAGGKLRIILDAKRDAAFAEFVMRRLPGLYADFKNDRRRDD